MTGAAAAARPRERSARDTLALALRWAVLPIAFAGTGVTAYLSYVHFADASVYCSGAGGCHTVQSSQYATLLSVPVALLGFVLYGAILAAGAVAAAGRRAVAAVAPFAVFGLSLSGMLYSGYLTWLELYDIHALCGWCVASACLLASTFLLSAAELAVSGRWRDAGEVEE